MDITNSRLTAAAGMCAAAAGAIFIGVQINHPPVDVAHIATTEMAVRQTAKAVMAILAVAGFTGMFLRHHRRLGMLGLSGYMLLSIGFLAMFAVECIGVFILPIVARWNPGYVQDVLDAAVGRSPSGDIGHLSQLLMTSGIGYSLGGLLFGIALFRSRALTRWATLLLAYGTTSALALAVLPESFSRPFALPTGVALIALGASLWRDRRGHVEVTDAPAIRPLAESATR